MDNKENNFNYFSDLNEDGTLNKNYNYNNNNINNSNINRNDNYYNGDYNYSNNNLYNSYYGSNNPSDMTPIDVHKINIDKLKKNYKTERIACFIGIVLFLALIFIFLRVVSITYFGLPHFLFIAMFVAIIIALIVKEENCKKITSQINSYEFNAYYVTCIDKKMTRTSKAVSYSIYYNLNGYLQREMVNASIWGSIEIGDIMLLLDFGGTPNVFPITYMN